MKVGLIIYLIFWSSCGAKLFINEASFGEAGYVEILVEEDEANPGQNQMDETQMIVAKRVKDKNVYVEAIIKMDNMVKTLDNHVLITTKSYPKIPSSSSNTLVPETNTKFGWSINEKNIFHMNEECVMVILITKGDISIPEFKIVARQKKIHFTEEILEKLKENLRDVLIFGGLRGVAPRKIVKFLYENSFLSQIQMPRRFSNSDQHSFSRCTISLDNFLSDKFKDTVPTPAMPNNCQTILPNSVLHLDPFIALSKTFEEMDKNCQIDTVQDFVEYVEESGMMIAENLQIETSGTTNTGDSSVEMEPSGLIESTASGSTSTISRFTPMFQDGCPVTMDNTQAMGKTDNYISNSLAKRMRMSDPLTSHMMDHEYSTMEWDHKYMTPSDELHMKTYQFGVYPINEMDRFCWIEYVIDPDDPKKSKIRCGLCYRNSQMVRLRESDMHRIMKEGVLYPSISENLRAIENHDKSIIHMRIIQLTKFNTMSDIQTNPHALNVMKPHTGTRSGIDPDSPFLITSRVIATAYELVRHTSTFDVIATLEPNHFRSNITCPMHLILF